MMGGMLRERCERIGLEHFEVYSFNQPTRRPLLYISYEVFISVCACAPRHVCSFDAFYDTNLRSQDTPVENLGAW